MKERERGGMRTSIATHHLANSQREGDDINLTSVWYMCGGSSFLAHLRRNGCGAAIHVCELLAPLLPDWS